MFIIVGESGKDACYGDAGGPLFFLDEINGKKKFIVGGIVSFGFGDCGSPGQAS